jgi:PAS domain S-box-containing protein
VATRNADSRIIDVNQAWVRQFGARPEQVIGKRGDELGLWRNMDDRSTVLAKLEREGEVRDYEAWFNTRHGKDLILCRISARIEQFGDDALIILAQEDITEQRQAQDKVRELNATLEHRVSVRTHELNSANQGLMEAMATLKSAQAEIQRSERLAALGALVAGVAHELNTPIGNCVTVASTLQELSEALAGDMERGLTRRALNHYVSSTRQASDMLMRNLRNAAELIGGFKQVAVDRTSSQRRRFELEEVVSETVLTMGPALKRSNHKVEVEVPNGIAMNSYPGPLGQVLGNLINNALLHAFEGKEHGTVRISAQVMHGYRVHVLVEDDGCGIPEVNLGRIFDPFFTTKLGRGGSGLGLNIVYNLVADVLGGTIRVESRAGEGTRFLLDLPLFAPAETEKEYYRGR